MTPLEENKTMQPKTIKFKIMVVAPLWTTLKLYILLSANFNNCFSATDMNSKLREYKSVSCQLNYDSA